MLLVTIISPLFFLLPLLEVLLNLAKAIDRFARSEVLQLEELPDLDLGRSAVDGGIGEAPSPFHRFFPGLHLDDRVAGDELLRLGEGPVDHGALRARVLDPPALRARLQARCIEQHSRFLQLLVVLLHIGHQLFRGHDARFRVLRGLDYHHQSHVVLQSGAAGYLFFFAATCARRRSSCSLSSGVNSAPKSSGSNTWRISISESSRIGLGQRFTHSIASCFDFTCQIQNPATSSLVSAKGPSMTVRLAPENRTRAPFELGCSPSPASITPAFTSSSLNFPIAARSFSSGITPASESLLALTMIMNRIVFSVGLGAGPPDGSGQIRSLALSTRRTRP